MSLFINTSVSADVVTNSLSFFFIAFILNLKFQTFHISTKQKLALMIMLLLMALVKLIYFPLVLLIFVIPINQFGDLKKYLITVVGVLFLGCIVLFGWYQQIKSLQLFYDEYNLDFRDKAALAKLSNMNQQLVFIYSNKDFFVRLLINSIISSFSQYSVEFIGKFGWLTVPLPNWLIFYIYFVIICVALMDGNQVFRLSFVSRIVFSLLFIILILLVFVSQYLTWMPVGANTMAIQGRYLIPFSLLLFIPFQTNLRFKKGIEPVLAIAILIGVAFGFLELKSRYF